jgi:AAA family ATP:ADP antiporter
VFARSSKYSLFDPAKEMVYIEMERDEKSRGKAAVDLVGSQIGKSGASWLTQAILLGMGSISAALPFIGVCFVGVCLMWIRATVQLQRQMENTEVARAERKAAGLATMVEDVMLSTDTPSPEPGPPAAAEAAVPAPVVPVASNGNGSGQNGNGHSNGNGNGHNANGNGNGNGNSNGNGNGAKPAVAAADASAEVVLADTGSKLKQA